MEILELVKDHDLLHGPENPMVHQQLVDLRREISSYRSKELVVKLNKLINKFPTSEWGIQPTLLWKRRSVSRKQKRLLLQQMIDSRLLLELEIEPEVDIFYWLSIELLINEILGKSPSPFYLGDKVERQMIGIGLCLLKYGNWNFREWRSEVDWLEMITTSGLSGYRVSTISTYWSRNQNYFFADWLSLRLDVVADPNTPGHGEPYSSYCKGYGMDRGSKRGSLTPYSAELDGEEELDKSMVLWKDHELATLLYLVELSTW